MHPHSVRAFVLSAVFLLFSAAGACGGATHSIEAAGMARDFRGHCVQIYVYGKSDDGAAPQVGDFAVDMANLRSTPFGGYWWSERLILAGDIGIDDRFVRSIEIALPGSGRRWPARLAGRFHRLQAILIEVLPDAAGELPEAHPIRFSDRPYAPDHVVASYGWENGEWRLVVGDGLGPGRFSDSGTETAAVDREGILLDGEGKPFGAVFGDEVTFTAGGAYWFGSGLTEARLVSAGEYERLHEALRQQLGSAVLDVRFRLRARIEDGELGGEPDPGGVSESTHEMRFPGLVTDAHHLFVPAGLDASAIARIESIRIFLPGGRDLEGEFVGACGKYMAVVVKTAADLPAVAAPEGFSFLNPMLVPPEAFLPGEEHLAFPGNGLFLRWRVDYDLGRRRERRDYDRWTGLLRGFREEPVVATLTNEEEGALAFDLAGGLIAVALAPRIPHQEMSEGIRSEAGFRPLGHIRAALSDPGAMDPTLMPTDAENGKRLMGLGVEWQGLDVNSARLFGAEKASRGGAVGLLVNHVYPDTPASEIGLREQDILLRLYVRDQAEPLELVPSEGHMAGFSLLDLEDVSVESVQRFMAELPPPWPSRENALSTLLTSIGVGRRIRLEFLREGEPRQAEFTTRFSPADYRSAPRHRMDALGITVKPVTYEVRRYFRRSDDSGVIVHKVEEGGLGGVAGLYPYLLITRVDGSPVRDFPDFKEKTEAFEAGAAGSVELMVEGFGKTRLVRVER